MKITKKEREDIARLARRLRHLFTSPNFSATPKPEAIGREIRETIDGWRERRVKVWNVSRGWHYKPTKLGE